LTLADAARLVLTICGVDQSVGGAASFHWRVVVESIDGAASLNQSATRRRSIGAASLNRRGVVQ